MTNPERYKTKYGSTYYPTRMLTLENLIESIATDYQDGSGARTELRFKITAHQADFLMQFGVMRITSFLPTNNDPHAAIIRKFFVASIRPDPKFDIHYNLVVVTHLEPDTCFILTPPPTERGTSTMNMMRNYSTAIFLINNTARAVMATYEADAPNKPACKTMFKTLDQSIKVGDFCIVPTDTRHNMTVVKITDIDVQPDFNSSEQMKWIIGVVRTEEFNKLVATEAQAINMIRQSELARERETLRQAMFGEDAVSQIKALPLAAINGTKAEKGGE